AVVPRLHRVVHLDGGGGIVDEVIDARGAAVGVGQAAAPARARPANREGSRATRRDVEVPRAGVRAAGRLDGAAWRRRGALDVAGTLADGAVEDGQLRRPGDRQLPAQAREGALLVNVGQDLVGPRPRLEVVAVGQRAIAVVGQVLPRVVVVVAAEG